MWRDNWLKGVSCRGNFHGCAGLKVGTGEVEWRIQKESRKFCTLVKEFGLYWVMIGVTERLYWVVTLHSDVRHEEDILGPCSQWGYPETRELTGCYFATWGKMVRLEQECGRSGREKSKYLTTPFICLSLCLPLSTTVGIHTLTALWASISTIHLVCMCLSSCTHPNLHLSFLLCQTSRKSPLMSLSFPPFPPMSDNNTLPGTQQSLISLSQPAGWLPGCLASETRAKLPTASSALFPTRQIPAFVLASCQDPSA